MSREEAIKNIKEHCYFANLIPPAKEALDMAIKALEQEPCADMVSRDAMWEVLQKLYGTEGELVEELMSLPLVLPMPKMGKWLNLKDGYGDICESVCSVCDYNGNYKWAFCPKCGCKMQEVEE